jgi:hypothetical protein
MSIIERVVVRILNGLRRAPTVKSDGLLLGYAADGGREPIYMPQQRRFEHAVIVGKTGAGKTHCLEQLAIQHLERGEGFCFLDYHGDATNHLMAFAAGHRDAAARLVLIDPTDPEWSPGLNPLEMAGASDQVAFTRSSELAAILKQRWGVDTFGARTEELMRNALYTLAVNGLTLVDAPTLLTAQTFRRRCIQAVTNAEVLAYWNDRYEPLSEAMKAVFREPLLNRVSAFITDPFCRHLLGQRQSTIDLARAINEGQWVLVNLSKGRLREHAHTLGNLIFARMQFEIMARTALPERSRRLFSIFCDEVQNLAENDLAILLSEGRKHGVSLYTAGQYWEAVPKELRAALFSAGTHIFFRVSAHDAATLAAELSAHGRNRYAQLLTTLSRGQAIVRVGWNAPVVVKVPAILAPTRANVAALREVVIARCARGRAVVEQEIQAVRRELGADDRPETRRANEEEHTHGQTRW